MCFSGSGPQTTASAIASSVALSAASSKYFGSASSESNDQGSTAVGHHSQAICRASFSVLAQHTVSCAYLGFFLPPAELNALITCSNFSRRPLLTHDMLIQIFTGPDANEES